MRGLHCCPLEQRCFFTMTWGTVQERLLCLGVQSPMQESRRAVQAGGVALVSSPHRAGQSLSSVLMCPQIMFKRHKKHQSKTRCQAWNYISEVWKIREPWINQGLIFDSTDALLDSVKPSQFWVSSCRFFLIFINIRIPVAWLVESAGIFTSPLLWGAKCFRTGRFLPCSAAENPV